MCSLVLHTMSLLLLLLLLNPKMPFKRTWNFILFVSLVLILLVQNSIKYAFPLFWVLLQFWVCWLISVSNVKKKAKLVALVGNDAFTLPISHLIFHFLNFDLTFGLVFQSYILILHLVFLQFRFRSNLADTHVKLHLLATQLRERDRET